MPRVLLISALVATAFWVFTIVDCAVQPRIRHRGVSKPIWILIVVFIPVLGGILWLLIGRVRASRIAPPRAPDDDPEFLGSLGAMSDQDERIRRLEEELAKLDAEGDDPPRWTPPGSSSATAAGSATPPPEPPPAPRTDGDDDTRGTRGAVG